MHSRMLRSLAGLVAMLALAAAVSGCALNSRPSVAELKYNPGRYQNKTVAIDGIVTSTWGVPLVPFKFYKVDDGTRAVSVDAPDGRARARQGPRERNRNLRRAEPRAAHETDRPRF